MPVSKPSLPSLISLIESVLPERPAPGMTRREVCEALWRLYQTDVIEILASLVKPGQPNVSVTCAEELYEQYGKSKGSIYNGLGTLSKKDKGKAVRDGVGDNARYWKVCVISVCQLLVMNLMPLGFSRPQQSRSPHQPSLPRQHCQNPSLARAVTASRQALHFHRRYGAIKVSINAVSCL